MSISSTFKYKREAAMSDHEKSDSDDNFVEIEGEDEEDELDYVPLVSELEEDEDVVESELSQTGSVVSGRSNVNYANHLPTDFFFAKKHHRFQFLSWIAYSSWYQFQ